jgi:hypothetical protein
MDTPETYTPAREERTEAEMEQLKQAAADAWS